MDHKSLYHTKVESKNKYEDKLKLVMELSKFELKLAIELSKSEHE